MPSTWFKSIFGVKVSEPCQMTSWKLHFFRKVQYKSAIFRPGPHFEILKIWIFEVYFMVIEIVEKNFGEKNSMVWFRSLNIGENSYFYIFKIASRATPIFWNYRFFQKCKILLYISKLHFSVWSKIVFYRDTGLHNLIFQHFWRISRNFALDLHAS